MITETFIRWVGCKRLLLNDISLLLPSNINNYYEPFLGSGIVFFKLINCNKAYLSDLNEPLINCFKQIRDNISSLSHELSRFQNTKNHFLAEKNKIYTDDVKRAAQFIFLNRTSFNGIYRVNKAGLYNVPYGNRKNVDLITHDLLMKANEKLRNAEISCSDFQDILQQVKIGDFVYFDPPYTTAHQNNGFIEYNKKLFSWDDQLRLYKNIKELNKQRINFILSNASNIKIKELYKDICDPIIVHRYSKIGGKGAKRGIIEEYLFTNVK